MGYKKQVWIRITEMPPNNAWKAFLAEWVCWVRWEILQAQSKETGMCQFPTSYQFPTSSETSFKTRLGWTCHAQQQICLQGKPAVAQPGQHSVSSPDPRDNKASHETRNSFHPSHLSSGCVTDVWSSDRIQLSCSADDTAPREHQASSDFIQIKKRFEPRSKYFAP